MKFLPTSLPWPATPEQHAEISRLLTEPRYNANHREYYARLLPGLNWASAARLIHELTGRYRARPAVLDYASQDTCPLGLQAPASYAAVVRLTRTAEQDSGGRFRRAQPGEPVHLSYHRN